MNKRKQMKLLTKINPKDIKSLSLTGIAVLEMKEGGNSTDFKGIELEDTITKTRLRIEMGPYSEINIYTEKPKELKDVFTLTASWNDGEFSKTFSEESEAKRYIEIHATELINPKITKTQVEA